MHGPDIPTEQPPQLDIGMWRQKITDDWFDIDSLSEAPREVFYDPELAPKIVDGIRRGTQGSEYGMSGDLARILPAAFVRRPDMKDAVGGKLHALLWEFQIKDFFELVDRWGLDADFIGGLEIGSAIRDALRYCSKNLDVTHLKRMQDILGTEVVEPIVDEEQEGALESATERLHQAWRPQTGRFTEVTTERGLRALEETRRRETENRKGISENAVLFAQKFPSTLDREGFSSLIPVAVQEAGAARRWMGDERTREAYAAVQPELARRIERLAAVVVEQEESKARELAIKREGHAINLLPEGQRAIPEDFLRDPFAWVAKHGTVIKTTDFKDARGKEMIWGVGQPGKEGSFVMKRIQRYKMPTDDYEVRIMQRAQMMGLPAPVPYGWMRFDGPGEEMFVFMEYAEGDSGLALTNSFGKEKTPLVEEARTKLAEIAKRYREEMFVDKGWFVRDCLLSLEGGRLGDVLPLDWERAHPYDPRNPEPIRNR